MKQRVPTTIPEYDDSRISERPDGFYWRLKSGGREYGPFASLLEVVEDMQYHDNGNIEPGETLEQAEDEIGVANWVDPETGMLAEECVPRLEDH